MLNQTFEKITTIAKQRCITYDEAFELSESFTECTPENYAQILESVQIIFAYHGVCNPLRFLLELVGIHFGYI